MSCSVVDVGSDIERAGQKSIDKGKKSIDKGKMRVSRVTEPLQFAEFHPSHLGESSGEWQNWAKRSLEIRCSVS